MRRTKRIVLLMVVIGLPLTALVSVFHAYSTSEKAVPQVVETSPLRGEELPLTGSITFTFDYPMDQTSVEQALTVDPPVQGNFTWSDDRHVTFQPTEPLK